MNAAGGGQGRPIDRAAIPEDAAWREMLVQLDLDEAVLAQASWRAARQDTSIETELLTSGAVSADRLFRAMAAALDIPFLDRIDPSRLIFREDDPAMLLRRPTGPQIARYENPDGEATILLAPDRGDLGLLADFLRRKPHLRERLRFTTPSLLRAAVLARGASATAVWAKNGLFDRFPHLSARIVMNAWQGAAVGALVVALPVAFALAPQTTFLVVHLASSLFFLSCVGLRLVAAFALRRAKPAQIASPDPARMPRYCVLVALYREAPIVPDLLVALSKLVWPRGKLEVKLVCEADDHPTLEALRAQPLKPWIEIVEVPPGHPRTKPKALNFALPLTSADFVVLYDAEDRPHPWQLIEAWQTFEAEDDDLACLQAPLIISNSGQSPLTRLFGFEYAALFRGLLPFLARHCVLLPLGGTSNHFRRAALETVGGWDAYNVTEDADLGARLVL